MPGAESVLTARPEAETDANAHYDEMRAAASAANLRPKVKRSRGGKSKEDWPTGSA